MNKLNLELHQIPSKKKKLQVYVYAHRLSTKFFFNAKRNMEVLNCNKIINS